MRSGGEPRSGPPTLDTDALRQRRRALAHRRALRRRRAGAALLVVAAAVLALALALRGSGGSGGSASVPVRVDRAGGRATTRSGSGAASGPGATIAPPHPGRARLVSRGPRRREVALTFDDGTCAVCVARIVSVLRRTGAHATFCPNGVYTTTWEPQAAAIRRLLRVGQLTICNHTYSHLDARTQSPDELAAELNRNERWIERTFGVTSRPYFRPPYGAFNSSTVEVAGRLGYRDVVLWSGTLADSSPHDTTYVIQAAGYWSHPGTIMLMHGNYPATARALPQIVRKVQSKGYRLVTLDELLGDGARLARGR
jgi:peptidoglycan/xylan/chitin deacetylase (PgdA/CDA1 family)